MMESHQERANLSGGIARRPFSTHASICAILFYFVSVVCVCVCGMENWNGYVHDPHELSIPTITFSTHLQEFG